jgi:ABC-type uncharacterized transport system ATPase subunit
MSGNGKRLHIPGTGNVEIGGPDPMTLLAAGLQQLAFISDLQLQVTLRLALGWDPHAIIRDLNLNVPPPRKPKVVPTEEPA